MSELVGVVHQFVSAPLVPVDPMGEAAWRELQPTGQDAQDITAAIGRVTLARGEAEARLERLAGERNTALLRGTAASVAGVDAQIDRARLWHERVTALAAALPTELEAARTREDWAAQAQAQREAQARPVIAKFAKWVREQYPRHAQAIAEGLKLEQEALAAARSAKLESELPRAHTSLGHPRGMPPTSFSRMVRLPAAEPGEPIAWPPGEAHPDFKPNPIRYV